jgi:hypothetical protein
MLKHSRLELSPTRSGRSQVPNFWRRKRDSNPRNPFEFNGFQDRRIKPLSHSSAHNLT